MQKGAGRVVSPAESPSESVFYGGRRLGTEYRADNAPKIVNSKGLGDEAAAGIAEFGRKGAIREVGNSENDTARKLGALLFDPAEKP